MNHQDRIAAAESSLAQHRLRATNGAWYPQYHAAPPAGWMNDPNGFIYFNGEYHLFYQHHPYSPHWDNMHWGHLVSSNLVDWHHAPIALAPSEAYDLDGCFSGSAIEVDGRLYLLYTGNVWTGENRDADLLQVQCLAVSEDGRHFTKYAGNPVIRSAPDGDIHPHHFRDPKVWRHDGSYYMILGSRTLAHQGQALLYASPDLKEWSFVQVLAGGVEPYGYMWECPDLFPLNGQDVLILSPQGMKPDADNYHNLHQSGYFEGKLNYRTGRYTHGAFTMLDYGFDFYAPQTTTDSLGRRIMIAWMAMWESEMPEREEGWAGAMTLPRELRYEQGRLLTLPVPELARLRAELSETPRLSVSGPIDLTERFGLSGDVYELELLLQTQETRRVELLMRVDPATGEETRLIYDQEQQRLILDRSRSGQGPGGVRTAPVRAEDGQLHLRIFMDRSSIEVFAQHGELAMTARIYPGAQATGIRLAAEGRLEVLELRKWALHKGMHTDRAEAHRIPSA